MKKRPHLYKLDGTTPVPVESNRVSAMLAWAQWLETASSNSIVKQESIGPYRISTVFLGLDHNHLRIGPPILFETMVFLDGEALDYQTRCSTWDEALAMHAGAVAWVKAGSK